MIGQSYQSCGECQGNVMQATRLPVWQLAGKLSIF
jgi:hypothetical protein